MKKITVKEFCLKYKVSQQAVQSRIKRGTLDAEKVGGKWYILEKADNNDLQRLGDDYNASNNGLQREKQRSGDDDNDKNNVIQREEQGLGDDNNAKNNGLQREEQRSGDDNNAKNNGLQREEQRLTKQDIENQSAQTRTLVNAHDNRWQHEIKKIHEDHSKEIRELRDEYKDEAKRKMMPFYVVCVIGLISLGGLLWYFNEQIKSEKSEKSELKKEHSEEVSLIQKEAKTTQNEIQSRLEASRLKSEASKTALQSKIDQLNEGRVVEAKAKAELSAELKILQADFERQKLEIQKEKAETKLKEEHIEQTTREGSERRSKDT